jgi:hypothetical protein
MAKVPVSADSCRPTPSVRRGRRASWPVRSGLVPPLATGFGPRFESVPGLEQVLPPGGAVLFGPAQPAKAPDWQAATGKTQLAAYAAQSLRWPGGLDLVAWVTAASRASVLSGYFEAASLLGLDLAGDAEAVAARFTAWLRSTTRRWLMVLDDVRDAADLERLWPAGASGRLLITACDPEVARGKVPAVPVGCLTPREAISYLSDRLPADPGYRTGQLDLAEALGGEPAALAHASAVIETAELSCRDYLEIFLGERAKLQQPGTGETAAAVTWRLSAHHAEILDRGGVTWPMLVLAALLYGHGIPLAVLTAPAACQYLGGGEGPAGTERARAAIRALGSSGLFDVDQAGTPAVTRMSGALQASVLAVAQRELTEQAAGAAADALLEAWPRDQPAGQLDALLRSCAASLLQAAGDLLWAGGRCHRVLLAAGQSLDSARMSGPAAAWWQQLTTTSGRLLGERHLDTIAAAGLLNDALLAAGRGNDAVTCAEWLLAARTGTLGPDHRDTIAARVTAGRALSAAGRHAEAVQTLAGAARHSELTWGPADNATLWAVDVHAEACLAAGQPREAAQLLARALAEREKARGRDDPAALASGERLAAAYLAAGQPGNAVTQYERVLRRRKRALGPGHPDTLAAQARLAGACGAAGQMSAALRHYQQAAAGYEQALGPGHPATLGCQAGLARAYYDAGHAGDAVKLLRAAIAGDGQELSPDDPATAALRRLLNEIAGEMSAR